MAPNDAQPNLTMFSPFRIVFMGTPEFAVPSLSALLAGPDQVVGVVSMPDRPKGRGRVLDPPPVKVTAQEAGVPVLQPQRLPEIRAVLEEMAPDLLVVVAYGKILRPWLLQLPRIAPVNVHASLLPGLRGAAPIQWAVVRGHTRSGVTIMKMDEGMDTGPIILQREEPIHPDDTAATLSKRLSDLGAEALMEALDRFRRGQVVLQEQETVGEPTYAPMIQKGDGCLDWSLPPEALDCFVRGMSPWPGAFTMVRQEPLQVRAVQSVPAQSEDDKDRMGAHQGPSRGDIGEGPKPGQVLRLDPRLGPVVACGSQGTQAVALKKVKPAGRNEMDGAAYVNGKPPLPGTVLGAE